MMRRADLSLEMIAGALGFCDAFHLSKAFKACHGLSPAAYRARLQIDS
jgi:transcriptional regulator GlxA family with amidase domain